MVVFRPRQAIRIQRKRVARFGGLPYMSKPMRKIFPAAQRATTEETAPIRTDSQICHDGGGEVEVIRRSMANELNGGRKLIVMESAEFGLRLIGNQRM